MSKNQIIIQVLTPLGNEFYEQLPEYAEGKILDLQADYKTNGQMQDVANAFSVIACWYNSASQCARPYKFSNLKKDQSGRCIGGNMFLYPEHSGQTQSDLQELATSILTALEEPLETWGWEFYAVKYYSEGNKFFTIALIPR